MKSELRERIRNQLRDLRETLNLSQEIVADRMRARGFRFTQSTVYKIEAGLRNVSVIEACALAQIYGIPVDDLGMGTNEMTDEYTIIMVFRVGREETPAELSEFVKAVQGKTWMNAGDNEEGPFLRGQMIDVQISLTGVAMTNQCESCRGSGQSTDEDGETVDFCEACGEEPK